MQTVAELKAKEKSLSPKSQIFTPQNIILNLNKFLKDKTPVVTDVGQHQVWTAQNIVLNSPRTFISSGGLGTMGFGIGAAIGAYFGTSEKPVLITGDGSFGMSLHELATAVSENIPLIILIMNNGVLGMVRQWQTLFYEKHYSHTVLDRKTDFIALAKAFGADGETVTDEEGLNKALKSAFDSKTPYIINCIIDKDELVLPMLPPGGSFDDIIVKVGE